MKKAVDFLSTPDSPGRPTMRGSALTRWSRDSTTNLARCVNWIAQFETVPLPRFCTVSDVAAEYAEEIEGQLEVRSGVMGLIHLGPAGRLAAAQPTGTCCFVMCGCSSGMGADWTHLRLRGQHRVSRFVSHLYYEHGRVLSTRDNHNLVFLFNSSACRWLVHVARQAGYRPEPNHAMYNSFPREPECRRVPVLSPLFSS